MKNLLTLLCCLFILNVSFAQDNASNTQTTEDQPSDYEKQQTIIYRLAKYFGDGEVARGALYNLLSLNTENTSLLDTLALEYFEDGAWLSAALVGQEVNKLDPEDEFALEVTATSLEKLGAKEKAAEFYESLYLKNESVPTLYKLAFLQYELNKHGEAKASADALLLKPEIKELEIVFRKADKKQQDISMEASVYNLKGLIAKAQGKKEDAKKHFEKALSINADFELAKTNLQNLNK